MLRLIEWLIFGHIHQWETVTRNKLSGSYNAVGVRIELRCTKCGNWKKKDLI